QGNAIQEGFGDPFRVTELHGESQQDPNAPPFPSSSTDYFRTAIERVPITLRWKALFAHFAFGYVAIRNQVAVTNWDGRKSLLFPMIVWLGGNIGDVLDILYNAQTDNVTLSSGGTTVFNGQLSVLLGDPTPPGFFIDPDIVRLITAAFILRKEITSNPRFLVFLVSQIVGGGGGTIALPLTGEPPKPDTIQVFYQDGLPPSGTVSVVDGHGVTVDSTFDDGFIEVFFATDTLPPVPATTLSYIDITVPDAINNPLTVPVVIRVDTSSTPTSVDEVPSTIPETMQLLQNYPNPFNPSTTISFDLRKSSKVVLHIYNLRGQLVRTLLDGKFNAGNHSVVWDGRDDRARQVTSGLYVTRMQAGDFVQHHKMLLIK
ncbi:MAG: FlgD immunoglobulin-like domain containing protein, partial [bacterium]